MSTSASAVTVTAPPYTVVASFSFSAFTLATSSLMAAQFSAMMNTMQHTMSSFRAELHCNLKETVEKAVKKARLATEVTFWRKENEKQYCFNELVQDKLTLTSLRIEEASANAAMLNPTVTTTSATSSTSTTTTSSLISLSSLCFIAS